MTKAFRKLKNVRLRQWLNPRCMSNGLQLGDNGWRSLLFCLIPFWGPHCVSAPCMSGAQKPKGDRRFRPAAAWPCPHSQKPRLSDRGELLSRWLRAGSPDRSVTAGGWACSSTCKNALPVIFHKKYLQHSLGGNPMPLGGGRSPVRKDASSLVFDILLDNCRGYFPDTTGKAPVMPMISDIHKSPRYALAFTIYYCIIVLVK